jgi:hypothetical protein
MRDTMAAEKLINACIDKIRIHDNCVNTAERFGNPSKYDYGANNTDSSKVADAMLDPCIVKFSLQPTPISERLTPNY